MPYLSGIESASGEDSSGIGPASGEDESGEDESGLESGSGTGMFWLFFTYLIWLFSEFMAVSFSYYWSSFVNKDYLKILKLFAVACRYGWFEWK